jgi:predicted RNA-binding Zn ribbon-like protein
MPATFRFPLLGEPLVLDLMSTRVRRNGASVDLLDTPSALSAWLRAERAHPDRIPQFVARNRRRIWCSGASRGNRSRVAKHCAPARRAI